MRYILVKETRSGPKSEVLRQEIHIDLTGINLPIQPIVFPQGCIDAKNTRRIEPAASMAARFYRSRRGL